MAKKKKRKRYDTGEAPPEVREALDLADRIEETYEDEVPDRAKEDGEDFFEGVLGRTRAIAETIDRTQRVTDGQLTALQNMLAGVEKWARGRGDD